MKNEYEATFYPITKDDARRMLAAAGAVCSYPERLMRRVTFDLPHGPGGHAWARVRDEGDRVTMSIKEMRGGMDGQKEEMVVIDSLENGIGFLKAIGCVQKAYQETRRELWKLDGAEITIDEWPFLDPFVEVEADSEAAVRVAAEKAGFKWEEARFLAAGEIYAQAYGVSEELVNQRTPRLVFGDPNPFI